MPEASKAVVLLSGGLDSYTAAAIARDLHFDVHALTVKYGQRHAQEILAARKIAEALGVKAHREIAVDLASLGGSALLGDGDIPKGGPDPHTIPATYVPARNTVMLALSLAWAEVIGAYDIFIGVNALDYSGYPDCRPEFIEAFEKMAGLATKAGVEGARFRIRAPLISMTKADIIRRGNSLGLDYGLTRSCYDPAPSGAPCGQCDSCVLRARGFQEAGIKDPLLDHAFDQVG
jgi:7-cyano-7-deazaguanine synthase